MTRIINHIFLSPPSLLPWVIILVIMVWGWLSWKSLQRQSNRWLGGRLILLSVAMLSLLLAGLQPARLVETSPGIAILLTDHPSKSKLDSLQQQYPEIPLFQMNNENANANSIPDLSHLHRHYPDIRQLFILGDGLHTSDLSNLDNYQVHFLLNPLPEGVIELSYTSQIKAGKAFQIEGLYHHATTASRKLILESPAGNVNLLSLEKAGIFPFELAFPTKEQGRYLFQIRIEGNEKQVLEEQVLPVEVTATQRPDVLLLNAAPSFETNYLKNWLADAGYSVAVRSTISRDKFRTEFHNRSDIALPSLSVERLQSFDLLVLNTYTLEHLNTKERRLIQQAIDKGLGLCLLAESPFPPEQLSRADRQYFLDFRLQKGLETWSVDKGQELDKIPLKIEKTLGISPLVKGNNQENIAAYRLKGKGRIALNLVNNTYQLLLNGQDKSYQNFWTPILEQTARSLPTKIQWRIPESPVLSPHMPLHLDLWSTHDQPVAEVIAPDSLGSSVFFRQHPFDREYWQARFWPLGGGWHWVGLDGERGVRSEGRGNEEGHWFYVQEISSAWHSLKVARQIKENQQWASGHPFAKAENIAPIMLSIPYPLWWFYLLFLFAAGLLWLEEKW